MLGVSGRWLPVVVVLLAAGGYAFAAESEGSGPVAKTVPQPAVESVYGAGSHGGENTFLVPPVSCQSARMSLGTGPLAGVYDLPASCRLLWLMAVAGLLSYSHFWCGAASRWCQPRRPQRHSQPPDLPAAELESQIPTCMIVCQQAIRRVDRKREINIAQTLPAPKQVSDPLESRPAPTLRPMLVFSSLLEFAQSGRGPPPVS